MPHRIFQRHAACKRYETVRGAASLFAPIAGSGLNYCSFAVQLCQVDNEKEMICDRLTAGAKVERGREAGLRRLRRGRKQAA
jgi:hypothetical protein